MAHTKQTVAEAIRDIRINLQYQSDYLRRLDEEKSELVARKLDRLRWFLKRFVEN
jgi:hypothetical protein